MCSTTATGVAILVLAMQLSGPGFAQTLSVKKEASNFVMEATTPANNPHNLQASENWDLWVDVRTQIAGTDSFALDTTSAVQRAYRLIPTPPELEPIRIMYLGDSMGSDCCGWGRGTYEYFKPTATVINYSIPGTSTKTFLVSSEKDNMLLLKPNYVLINYGFIDGGTDLRSTTLEEFETNLRTITQMVRSFNGVPIMVTVHTQREWNSEEKVFPNPTTVIRNGIMSRLATELGTPLVDLQRLTIDYFNELGPEKTAFMEMPGFPGDNLHFSQAGAQHVARILLSNMPRSLGPYLTGIFERPPIP